MSALIADLAFVVFVAALTGLATDAVWWPSKNPPRCDTCGRRHDGECPSATPAHRVPTWAREEHTP